MMKNPETSDLMPQVLFVCTGNTCRSPMAELCFAKLADGRFRSVSAGLHAFDGEAMSSNSLAVLAENGIDGSSFRSQSVTFDLVQSSTLILTMCGSHRLELLMRYPDAAQKCTVLRHRCGGGDVMDPYGQNIGVYRKTFAVIEETLKNWIDFLTINN